MDIEKARAIVAAVKDYGEAYISHQFFSNEITLEGHFTAEQLIAIATLMQADEQAKATEAA